MHCCLRGNVVQDEVNANGSNPFTSSTETSMDHELASQVTLLCCVLPLLKTVP